MTAPRDLPRDIGGFIRDLRRNAQISLRQLAEQAGVSNPYLSQIERGLRKPSAEVLAQLAHALRVSTPMMYLRAGLLETKDGAGVLDAIAADTELTIAQKQSLTQIYETFRRENARLAGEPADSGTAGGAGTVDGTTADAGATVDTTTARQPEPEPSPTTAAKAAGKRARSRTTRPSAAKQQSTPGAGASAAAPEETEEGP